MHVGIYIYIKKTDKFKIFKRVLTASNKQTNWLEERPISRPDINNLLKTLKETLIERRASNNNS